MLRVMALRQLITTSYNSIAHFSKRVNRINVGKCENYSFFVSAATRSYSSSPDIATYDEIKNLPKKKNILLIDVREPQELADTGVVPTSINIPLGQVKEKLSSGFSNEEFKRLYHREKPTSDTEIIFMCKIGVRSQKATDLSKTLGFTKSRNYLGSWTEWSEKEGIVKK